MSRISTIVFALGLGLLGVADAGAQGRHPCGSCSTTSTTRYYRTIHPLLYVTRYHDRSVYEHVTRLHQVVDVTRVQPIVHVDDVTRIHHVTVVHDAFAYQPQAAIPDPDDVRQVPAYAPGCGCMD